MKRKLIKQGAGGYTIYLPKKWVETCGLNAGQEVELTEQGNSLFLSSALQKKRVTTITLKKETEKDVKNLLTHLYRVGFDEIIFNNAQEIHISAIRKQIPLLLGFEFSREKNVVRIEGVSEPTEEKYATLLRRCFLINKELHANIVDAHEEEIQELKDQLDKYVLFCRRVLIKRSHQLNTILEWELLTFLMHIGHAYYYLHKEVPCEQAKKVLSELGKMVAWYMEAYFTQSREKITVINERSQHVKVLCDELLKSVPDIQRPYVAQLRSLARLFQIGTSPILAGLSDFG